MISARQMTAALASRKTPLRQKLGCLLIIPVIAALSLLLIAPNTAITTDHPGGSHLEIAFWGTAIAAAFLSFIMMDVLFRSQETRNLAPFPIPPLSMFVFQIGRVFKTILLTTVPVFFFWLPHLPIFHGVSCDAADYLRFASCVFIWPFGLSICAVVSAAILVYTGNNAATGRSAAQSASMAFSAAPAIALATSLILTLLLKLLAEALMKPGFFAAALTAFAITFGAFIAALCYAAFIYHKHYYSILARFIDTDLIVINANYAFLDDAEARQIQSKPDISAAISHALCTQYKRRHSAATLLIVTFSVLLAATLWSMPEYLQTMWTPGIALAPYLFLSKPWLSFNGPDLDPAPLSAFSASDGAIRKARIKATFVVAVPQLLLLLAALFIPAWIHRGLAVSCIIAAQMLAIAAILTIGLTLAAERKAGSARVFTYATALVLTICAFIF